MALALPTWCPVLRRIYHDAIPDPRAQNLYSAHSFVYKIQPGTFPHLNQNSIGGRAMIVLIYDNVRYFPESIIQHTHTNTPPHAHTSPEANMYVQKPD
jgi:hypothetical protein